MTVEAWLPVGFELPGGARSRRCLHEGTGWQILETRGGGRALVAREELADRWAASGLIGEMAEAFFTFGDARYWALLSGKDQVLAPVAMGRSPNSKDEALAFALALRATRDIDKSSPLQDAVYVEKISRLLPTYSISSATEDDIVLGYWLTGGASLSVKAFRRLSQTLSWLGSEHLKEVVEAAGFKATEAARTLSRGGEERIATEPVGEGERARSDQIRPGPFTLPGRPTLAAFFNEHIVDIVRNQKVYERLGIGFPAAVVLHGPPGCGKTFAVERLVDFLEWPSFQIDASSVASPYIHETSKKVAEVFEKAMASAPSVLVIDEMEAFLASRESGPGQHRVEEVAEFLRRIPEASRNRVLVLAMTNRVDMIDPAVLRRGRFDHVIQVDYASEEEILSLLEERLSSLPKDEDVDPRPLAKALANRPLSDVAFVLREGARLAARSGKSQLDQASLEEALKASPVRGAESPRRIGFV
jgi:hypothetical protein